MVSSQSERSSDFRATSPRPFPEGEGDALRRLIHVSILATVPRGTSCPSTDAPVAEGARPSPLGEGAGLRWQAAAAVAFRREQGDEHHFIKTSPKILRFATH